MFKVQSEDLQVNKGYTSLYNGLKMIQLLRNGIKIWT